MEIQDYKEIEIFKNNISTFKETSHDTDGRCPGYMTESEIEVINFDKVKEDYVRGMKLSNAQMMHCISIKTRKFFSLNLKMVKCKMVKFIMYIIKFTIVY